MGSEYSNSVSVIIVTPITNIRTPDIIDRLITAYYKPRLAKYQNPIRERKWLDALKNQALYPRFPHDYLGFNYRECSEPYSKLGIIDLIPTKPLNVKRIEYTLKKEFFIMLINNSDFKGQDNEAVRFFLELVQKTIGIFKAEYAWGGLEKRDIFGNAGKDPRRKIWGYNYFGKDIVNRLNIDVIRLLEKKEWKVEDGYDGGVFLAALPNPYRCSEAKKEEAARILNIEERLKDILVPNWGPNRQPLTIEKDFWKEKK